MPAVTVRNISEATHRAIKQRARLRGVSAEAEIRTILEEAVHPPERVKLGTKLYEWSRSFEGADLDIQRVQPPRMRPISNDPTGYERYLGTVEATPGSWSNRLAGRADD